MKEVHSIKVSVRDGGSGASGPALAERASSDPAAKGMGAKIMSTIRKKGMRTARRRGAAVARCAGRARLCCRPRCPAHSHARRGRRHPGQSVRRRAGRAGALAATR
jgi:hypothetical protein